MKFIKESFINAPRECVFAFHEIPDAVEQLTPPWEKIEVKQKATISEIGSRAIFERRVLGFTVARWVAEHTEYDPPNKFVDIQVSGPFKKWHHQHIFIEQDSGTLLRDEIDYELIMPYFGVMILPTFVVPRLNKMFDYRHEVTRKWSKEKC